MADDPSTRYTGPRYRGERALSPYPVSRLAPVHDLIDAAAEIQQADQLLGTGVNAKMETIIRQIRALQEQARQVLAEARDDALLHRAACNFKKRIGTTYHLYARDEQTVYFSMLAPADWNHAPPHPYRGSFRLEPDMSWSRVDGEHGAAADARRDEVPRFEIDALLPAGELRHAPDAPEE